MKRVGVWLFVNYKRSDSPCIKDFPDNKTGHIKARNYAKLLNKQKFRSLRGILGDKKYGIDTQFYAIEVFDKMKESEEKALIS